MIYIDLYQIKHIKFLKRFCLTPFHRNKVYRTKLQSFYIGNIISYVLSLDSLSHGSLFLTTTRCSTPLTPSGSPSPTEWVDLTPSLRSSSFERTFRKVDLVQSRLSLLPSQDLVTKCDINVTPSCVVWCTPGLRLPQTPNGGKNELLD